MHSRSRVPADGCRPPRGALVINDSNGNNLVNSSIFGMSLYPAAGFTPGVISTFAGTGTSGSSGQAGPAIAAQLAGPTGTSIDGFGNIYIADSKNNKVLKVTPSGTMSVFAGPARRVSAETTVRPPAPN